VLKRSRNLANPKASTNQQQEVSKKSYPEGVTKMAKIIYAPTVTSIVGRSGTGVYYRAKSSKFGYMRSWAYPVLTPNNHQRGAEMQNLKTFLPAFNPEGMEDLVKYVAKYKQIEISGEAVKTRANSPFAVFIKALWGWHKDNPDTIDLLTIEPADIITAWDPTDPSVPNSVYACVLLGWLPAVDGYTLMTKEWFV